MKTFTSNIKIVTINAGLYFKLSPFDELYSSAMRRHFSANCQSVLFMLQSSLKKYLLYAARQLNCTYLVPTNHRIIRMYKHKTAIELHFFDTMMSFNHAK